MKKKLILIGGLLSFCLAATALVLLVRYQKGTKMQEETARDLTAIRDEIAAKKPVEKEVAEDEAYSPQRRYDPALWQESFPGVALLSGAQLEELYNEMHKVNGDYRLWLQIPDTKIDLPVTQFDNAYYLDHDFYGRKNARGTLFLDENCDVSHGRMLIHGHRMKDGTMFAGLSSYKNKDYAREHKTALICDFDEEKVFTFFAAAQINLDEEGSFLYEELPAGEEELQAYVQELSGCSLWFDSPEVTEDSQLLVLSTCDYGHENQRLAVFGIYEKPRR